MRALLPVSFVVTFSCAHVPRAGVPVVTTQDEAAVVFVRPAHLVGSAIAPFIDDRLEVLARGSSRDFRPVTISCVRRRAPRQAANMFPRDTRASTGFAAPISRLRLTPGSVTYVRVDVGSESFAAPRVELVPLRAGSLAEQRARASMEPGAQATCSGRHRGPGPAARSVRRVGLGLG